MEKGFRLPTQPAKKAFLIEKGVAGENWLREIIALAQKEREDGHQILIARMNKNKKFQKEQLTAEGYEEFREFYKNPLQH